jgi:hypothetical protein
MEDVHPFPPVGGNVAQRQWGISSELAKQATPHQRSAARRVFRQKDGSRKAVHPFPPVGGNVAQRQWGISAERGGFEPPIRYPV